MEGASQDRGTFKGIAATPLALALLAERAAGHSFPVRFIVLAILRRAESVASAFVTTATGADCLAEPPAMHYGVVDAERLALRLRMLAAVLGVLADAAGDSDDRSHEAAYWSHRPGDAPLRPVLLVVRLPVRRRPPRPHDTS
ncbi:MAG: hypothetical protein F9K19_10780 [Rhizobiaceae bacterium]|nr:MAG: hypothetical protein F9K19_10780 [Rhizobiaceae bacterium]CAG0955738.1 hypothetical protein RHIZO_00433 [Rhizobiaceae bacterium]